MRTSPPIKMARRFRTAGAATPHPSARGAACGRQRRRPWIIIYFALFLTLLGSGQCPAEERTPPPSEDFTQLSMEQLMSIPVENVVTASKFQQKVTDAPASITVVTAEEIKHFGYRTLADILRSVRGFYVSYDRNYAYLGVRGFSRPGDYNSRVLLLVDGHRINDNTYGQASFGTEFPVDVDLIDRVEIVRGPGSSLYGTNAFFAVINVLTRTGQNVNGVELSGSAASQYSYKGRVSYGDTFASGLTTLLSGTYFDSDGEKRLFYPEYADPATNYGMAVKVDGDRSGSLFSATTWHDVTVTGVYANREKVVPTGAFGTVFDSPQNQTTDERAYVDVKYDHRINDDTAILARAAYDYYHYAGDYLYARDDMLVLNKDKSFGAWLTGELQLTRKLFEGNLLTAGTEVRYNLRQEQRNFDDAPFQSYLNDNHHNTDWALYLQDEWHIFDSLSLNVGVRYDHYPTFGGTTNPRAALIYKPWEKTVLKALYGEAFRAPTAYELYYQDSQTSIANPLLQPEKIHTYELVYEQYIGDHFRSSLSGYWYKINDLITQGLDPATELLSFQNVGSVEAMGVEMEVEGRWAHDTSCRASYSYGNAKNQDTGDHLTNSPRHLATLNATFPLFTEYLLTGIDAQYVGTRKTLAGLKAASYVTANLTLFSRNLVKGLEVSGSIYNLFGHHYGDPGSEEHLQDVIGQDGRLYRIKLTYRF